MTETTAEKLTRLILLADHPDQSPCDAIRFDQECGAAWRAGRLIAIDTPTCGEPARIWANMDPTIDKGVFTEGVWYAEPGMLLHSPEYIAASALRGAMADALEAQAAKLAVLRAALEWYGEMCRLARLIHSGGDIGRHAIAADGGSRAIKALKGTAP